MRLSVALLALTLSLAASMDSTTPEQSQKVLGDAAAAVNAASGEPRQQQKKNPFDADFEKFALSKLEEWHVPGLSIAVIDGDETWSAVSLVFSIILLVVLLVVLFAIYSIADNGMVNFGGS
jgi:hypothetical protein